jgi:hypothetical protein
MEDAEPRSQIESEAERQRSGARLDTTCQGEGVPGGRLEREVTEGDPGRGVPRGTGDAQEGRLRDGAALRRTERLLHHEVDDRCAVALEDEVRASRKLEGRTVPVGDETRGTPGGPADVELHRSSCGRLGCPADDQPIGRGGHVPPAVGLGIETVGAGRQAPRLAPVVGVQDAERERGTPDEDRTIRRGGREPRECGTEHAVPESVADAEGIVLERLDLLGGRTRGEVGRVGRGIAAAAGLDADDCQQRPDRTQTEPSRGGRSGSRGRPIGHQIPSR